MASFSLRAAAILLLVAASGCAGTAGPSFGGGAPPLAAQRQEAELFDPYPQTAEGPDVLGGRPRDFDRPAAEATRARTFSSWMRGLAPSKQQ